MPEKYEDCYYEEECDENCDECKDADFVNEEDDDSDEEEIRYNYRKEWFRYIEENED